MIGFNRSDPAIADPPPGYVWYSNMGDYAPTEAACQREASSRLGVPPDDVIALRHPVFNDMWAVYVPLVFKPQVAAQWARLASLRELCERVIRGV